MWAKHKQQSGFTIVELLIVIVVIGILAAITIVAYNGIQERAKVSAVRSALTQANKKIAITQVDTSNAIPTCPEFKSIITGIALNPLDGCSFDSGSINYQYKPSSTTYCITATTGSTSYTATGTNSPTSGSCNGHSNNGVPTITNLATNPSAEINNSGVNGSRDTTWASSGIASFKQTPTGASTDTFLTYGGDLGGFRMGMQAGKTYTISATIRLASAMTTGTGTNGLRQVTAWYTTAGGSHVRIAGTQAPNATGATRVWVTYSIPSDATAAWIRLYNGASSASEPVWYDDIMITEGSTQYSYADGTSLGWDWTNPSSPHNSTSTGTPL